MASDLHSDFPPGSERISFSDITARDHARQHNGNVYNNYAYKYTLRKRRSDDTLQEGQRNEALLRAAAEGQAPRVRYLVHLGVDLDYSDDDGFTALHHAVLSGFEDVAEILLQEGADVNAQSLDCGTPLHLAAMKARRNVADVLLKFRANANASSHAVGSPLHCTGCSGDIRIASTLLDAGADVMRSYIVRIDLIYSMCGVPPPERSHFLECDSLYLAARTDREDVIRLLLAKSKGSIDTFARSWVIDDGSTTSHDAAGTRDKAESTPLMAAAARGYSNLCRELLDNGANIDMQSRKGVTALMVAASFGHLDTLEVLLDRLASIHLYDSKGMSALFWAASYGHVQSVRLIASYAASGENQTSTPHTALHVAIQKGYLSVIEALLERLRDAEREK